MKMNRSYEFYSNILMLSVYYSLACGTAMTNSGFIVYCPCMGRFGNQADHFLGALAFSKAINRTLILPPWVEYRYGETKSVQVPFSNYFDIEELRKFHSVIPMEDFMMKYAPEIWPEKKRVSFCYIARTGDLENSCNAKSGNPFGPFWDTFQINFANSEFYGPLNYDAHNLVVMKKWKEKYQSEDWPVLAFTGAPASFPVQKENVHLHKYLKWSQNIRSKAKEFIEANFKGGSVLGIHLRNGLDWVKACEHVKDTMFLFSSPQCVGYNNEKGPLTKSMCLPAKQEIIRQIRRALTKIADVKSIFVASDSNHMLEDLREAFNKQSLKVVKLPSSNPHLDLAILGQTNYFIGNCVSSFSAFVKRERDVKGLPSEFWSFPHRKKPKREEL